MGEVKGKIPAVIDTNVIISAIIRGQGYSRAFLVFFGKILEFHAPKTVIEETLKHASTISRKMKGNTNIGITLEEILHVGRIELMDEEVFGPLLRDALKYVRDEYDAPFVAVAMGLRGGKKLIITRNTSDYLAEDLEKIGIFVKTPEEIVKEYGFEYVSEEHRFKVRGRGFRISGKRRSVLFKRTKK